jgi:hypothetical protein
VVGGEENERIRGFEDGDLLLVLVVVVVVVVVVGSDDPDPLASVSSPPVPIEH